MADTWKLPVSGNIAAIKIEAGTESTLAQDIQLTYQDGYNDGHAAGYEEGHSAGHAAGWEQGEQVGYENGHEAGYNEGYNTGYSKGLQDAGKIPDISMFIASANNMLQTDIWGNISIMDVLTIALAISCIVIFLKYFAGG